MSENPMVHLSRRERQIMDAVLSLGEASAADIRNNIPDPPTDPAVRRMIAILVEKGMLTYRSEGNRHIYRTAEDVDLLRKSAARHLQNTFFKGSTFMAVSTMLDPDVGSLSEDELQELADLIEQARREES